MQRTKNLLAVVATALALTVVSSPATAETLTVAWDINPEPEVVGYVVHIGNEPGVFTQRVDVGNTTTYVLTTAQAGQRYCFAVSAYFAGPVEGSRSLEVCTNDNQPPTLANPGAQNHPLGQALSFTLSATDPESAPLTFTATGLPTGLAVARATGVVSGTPTQAGTFNVRATVSDSVFGTSQDFTWTVVSSPPPAPTAVRPAGAIATATPTFEWQSAGIVTRYRLWVDDASAVNPRIQRDLTPADAGCAVAGSMCRFAATDTLAAGPASWSVRATNAAGDGPWSGAMDFSVPDGRAPVVTIVTPSSAATYSTTTSTLALGGTASDDVAVVQVTWANNRGGAGSASGTASWNVASIPLLTGSNVITVTARDGQNNVSTDLLTVTRTDGQPPTVEISLPTSGAAYSTGSAALALGGVARDEYGVTEVRWANSRGGAGLANGTTSWGVPAVALQPGSNVITVTARDASGQVGTTQLTVSLTDGTAPTITIVSPSSAGNHSTTSSSIALAGTASDAFGVTQVTWANSRGGSGTASGTTGWSVGAIALQPGDNVIAVTARDAAGQTGTATLTATLADGAAPTVTITVPTSASTHTTAQGTIGLSGTANDAFGVSQVSWTSDRGGSGAASGTNSWSVASLSLQPGVNTITVTARDASGRTGNDIVTITRTDNDPPAVAITTPTAAATHSTGVSTLALAGTASDAFGIAQVTWVNNRGSSGTASGTTAWSIAAATLRPGENVITITARDTGGNSATDVLTVTLTDQENPTVTISSPTEGVTYSTASATVSLGGSAADAFGVTEVRWSNDKGGSGVAAGTASWTVASIALSPGANVVTVTARDAAGRTVTDTITLTRTDNEAPAVSIVSPTANPTLGTTTRTLSLGGTASDTFGISQVSWANDRGGSGAATGTTAWSVQGVTLQLGVNVVTVTARDAAGNTSRDALAVTLTDGDAPTIRIVTPTQAAAFPTIVPAITVGGTAADEIGVTRVTWTNSLGGGGNANGTTAWSIPDVALKPGVNVVTVTAADAAGNASRAVLSITATDSQRPTVAIASPTADPRFVTTQGAVGVSGTARDDFGLTAVTWTNDRGGSGTASGTTAWSIANLALQPGQNTITVTATDAAGNTSTDVLAVRADSRKPTVAISQPVSTSSHAVNTTTLDLAGTAADDQELTEVSWSSNRGGRGVAVGTANWRAPAIPVVGGINVLTVSARDGAGNVESTSLTVVMDTRAPGVVIESPTTAPSTATNASAVTLRGAANDDLGVTQVSWSSDRGGSGVATGATAWSVANLPLLAGRNIITVTARDAAGNSSTDSISVVLDTRAPVVTISTPVATGIFSTGSNGVGLAGGADDESPITEVSWTNNRGGAGVATGSSRWSIDRVALRAGVNDVTVTARDAAGNMSAARLRITATDGLAPTVNIHSPSPANTFATALKVINIAGAAADDFEVAQVAWASDRGVSGVARGTDRWIVANVPLQPGVNVIAVTAVDGAGRTATDVLRVTVDDRLPAVSITSPASGYRTATPSVIVTGTASDDAGIEQVTFATNHVAGGVAQGTSSWTTPEIRLEPGYNIVTVTARDVSGNVATTTTNVVYEPTPPTRTGGSSTPTTATLPVARPAAYDANVAPKPATSPAPSPTAPKPAAPVPAVPANEVVSAPTMPAAAPPTVDFSAFAQSPQAMSPPARTRTEPVTRQSSSNPFAPEPAAPETSNLESVSSDDREPPSPPVVVISAPGASDTAVVTDSNITLAGTARHAAGITHVTWSTDRGASGTALGRERWIVRELALPIGTTVVTVTATNAVGDVASDVVVLTRRSAAGPALAIEGPTAESAWKSTASTVALRGIASDNVVRVTWAADWGGSGTASGTKQWTIPTIGLQVGANRITVRAHDASGGATERIVTVTYAPRAATASR